MNSLRLEKIVKTLAENGYTYNISISGPVASGKSTLCDTINSLAKDLANFNYYPEWISYSDLCGTLLKMSKLKEIGRLTLQSFILDVWVNVLREKPLSNFNLFDRSISECSMCYCGDLSAQERNVLRTIESDIAFRYNLPSDCTDFYFTISHKDSTEDILHEVLSVIENDVAYMVRSKTRHFNRIFGMKIQPPEVLVQRICQRNRSGEEDLKLKQMESQVATFKKAYSTFNDASILMLE